MANRTQAHQRNYYTNPAFCQKSEYYAIDGSNNRKGLSPVKSEKSARQSPLGAQTVIHNSELSPLRKTLHVDDDDNEYEQEFYEEMLVDDTGYVQEKKILVISSPQKETTHQTNGGRYASPPMIIDNNYHQQQNKSRYEYIPVQYDKKEEVITPSGRIHRYALIQSNDGEIIEHNPNTKGGRYSLVPLEEIQSSNKNRYAVIPENKSRYEYIDDDDEQDEPNPTENIPRKSVQRQESYRQTHQQKYTNQNYHHYHAQQQYQQHQQQYQKKQQEPIRRGNPIATQKLHELLQSPKQIKSPQTPRKIHQVNPNIIISNSPLRKQIVNPRVHQQLRYNNIDTNKKTTAIVQPICTNSNVSVYSDTTTMNKSESWMNLNFKKPAVQGTLAVAALMMCLCGGVTSCLCFYMILIMGKLYFLEFGIVSGFTCCLLGILGFRTRNCYWLPNRNYISGNNNLINYFYLSILKVIVLNIYNQI